MATLNELIARWLLKRLRSRCQDELSPETQALTAFLEDERRRLKRLKHTLKDRDSRYSELKLRHEKLKTKMQETKDLLHTVQDERDDAATGRRLETLQRQDLEWELGRMLSRPGIVPLAGNEERRDWQDFAKQWRGAWEHTMRLGVLRQHEPRPAEIERFPAIRRDDDDTAWPSVSIITPSFQQAAFLERTILSVLHQQYPRLEYHVIDGGSTDGSVEVIKRHESQLMSWSSSPDPGAASAINAGFDRCTGEIMAWLNSDDLLMPEALRFIADYFARHPEVDAVYGHRIIIDERDQQVGRWVLPPHDAEMLLWADYIPQETLFWRRSLWDRVGGKLDETFGFAFDWDLLLRFQQAGANIVRLPFFLGCFRVHDRQKSMVEINTTGRAEVERIRQRTLGNQFSIERLERRAVLFQKRALRHDRLLRWRLRTPFWWRYSSKPARPPLVSGQRAAVTAAVATYHFCTYFDQQYAAYGIAMLRSLLRHCPQARVTVLCLDDALEEILAEMFDSRVETMRLSVLTARRPVLKSRLASREPWERYALMKPFLIEMLLDRLSADGQLAFVDADLYFFADPTPLFQEASGSVATSPHRFNAESEHLIKYGRFNAGFNIWRNDAAARTCLQDWSLKCSEWCQNHTDIEGKFMDQGYLNEWPHEHSGVVQLSHPGHNLAPWNVGTHRFSVSEQGVKVDGRPLLFFHFSGLTREESGKWKTYYTFPSLTQDIVLYRIFQPFCTEVEHIRADLLKTYGLHGTGSVREFAASMPMLDVYSPQQAGRMIWLPSFPRSGNRLVRLILDGLFKAKTFTIYSQLGEPDIHPPAPEWQGVQPNPAIVDCPFEDCFFIKTHELPSSSHSAMYIVRDGRDAYVSYAHFIMQHFPQHVEGMTYLEVLRMLVESTGHYAGWSAHVLAWTSRTEPTAVIRYEEMMKDPAGAVARACETLGVTAPPATGGLPGFDELKAAEPTQFRRGKVGAWRDEMPSDIEELFWKLHGHVMTRLAYER
jgi:glycosyltransferase involved in cell wall biosynthesis